MEYFETQNLIVLHLVWLTSLKSNVICFNFSWDFCFFLTFYVWFRVCNTLLLCLFHVSLISGCIFLEYKFQMLGLLLFLFYFSNFFISNWIKTPNNPFKLQTRTRENRSPFYGRIEPYFSTLRFHLSDNFEPEPAQICSLSTPKFRLVKA
jgi:hypothetical protein